MIGIDHSKASIEFREKFAFTKSKVVLALNDIRNKFPVSGCVIISTCNRTEIWFSKFLGDDEDIYKVIGEIYDMDESLYREFFTVRHGNEAVKHLFELSCGLKSKIIGEDQILTQVKESASISREEGTIDTVLEKLFQMAITSAKRVKTNVRLTPVDTSVATKVLDLLKVKYTSLKEVKCLVIGNGEVGRLTAKTLVDAGCSVSMTLRQYKRGVVQVPEGCRIIQYDDRIDYVNESDVVISGTLSPHYTLIYDDVKAVIDDRKRLFIDLAIPRDIDTKIKDLEGVELYDIDSLSENENSTNEVLEAQIIKVESILNKYINEFKEFYYNREIRRVKFEMKKKSEVN
ncbi:glutamyl-tRNA reductase hemA [Clostridium cylindrosporum DSM 605]|uniref:Glutamyl-tRNA reductase n=2 Tax=Clostridium cylindrosporum TaxID=1495 RepID=A0A0J8G259_CLOCY|nr:glutamyl-tRNA reductase hemA [Clostridium cylindrosporum DSM 605]